MSEKILVIRMTGLGDVLAIGLPAIRYLQNKFPQAEIHMLTFGEGKALIELAEPSVTCMTLPDDEWPNDLLKSMESFLGLAEQIIPFSFDQIINLDTAFMPCLLARFLKDAGEPVSGNYINKSVQVLLDEFQQQSLEPDYVLAEQNYMDSTFFTMSAWFGRWWEMVTVPDYGYPEYYLKNCCAFTPLDFDMSLPINAQRADEANKRIGLCLQQAEDGDLYPYTERLQQSLQDEGFEVWVEQGSEPIQSLAQSIADCDLLITKSATARWLALAVDTQVLLISGAMEPKTLMPDYATEAKSPCPIHGPQQGQGISKICGCDKVLDLTEGVKSIFDPDQDD